MGSHHFEIPFDAAGKKMGALRGVGFGRQRRDDPASEAVEPDGYSLAAADGQQARRESIRSNRHENRPTRIDDRRVALVASTAHADPLTCNLTGYKALPGLTAAVADNTLAVTWDGDGTRKCACASPSTTARRRSAISRCAPRAGSGRRSPATRPRSTRSCPACGARPISSSSRCRISGSRSRRRCSIESGGRRSGTRR